MYCASRADGEGLWTRLYPTIYRVQMSVHARLIKLSLGQLGRGQGQDPQEPLPRSAPRTIINPAGDMSYCACVVAAFSRCLSRVCVVAPSHAFSLSLMACVAAGDCASTGSSVPWLQLPAELLQEELWIVHLTRQRLSSRTGLPLLQHMQDVAHMT